MEPAPPPLPVSFSRTASNGSNVENLQLLHSAMGSFDGAQASFSSSAPLPTNSMMYGNSQQSNMAHPSIYRSYSDLNGQAQQYRVDHQSQIYTAVYSGVNVYEMEVNGIAVMRRRSDSWLNATQILKVAGIDKGKRTKVLEKEILTGEHEKVQGGYGKYQGTWVDYHRGRQFCRQYGVEELLRPLLDYDVASDGSGAPGRGIETPTKEQAMAANRKRLYNTSVDGRGGNQTTNGTLFSVSPAASNALAAMSKVARLNSPAPKSVSGQRRPGGSNGRSSQPISSQESRLHASQQSIQSVGSERSLTHMQSDTTYGTMGQMHTDRLTEMHANDAQEPPRKRIRPSSSQDVVMQSSGTFDATMREGTPTEPNESFVYQQAAFEPVENNSHFALPPLPRPTTKADRDRQYKLLDLFERHVKDYASHDAIKYLSGAELDIPLDNAANTALHWAATLARLSLMRLLISKGANMFRGNAAGQTPLMQAVLVTNCHDHGCFADILDMLSPLIEIRDMQGRTIVHHIAMASGVDRRAASSKYYLEALLEFLLRNPSNPSSQNPSFEDGPNGSSKRITLFYFIKEIVNVQDRAGNTALNLAARIGNRTIIKQLLEVNADPTIPNRKGFSPIDFGVDAEPSSNPQRAVSSISSPTQGKLQTSKVDEASRDFTQTLSSLMSQAESQFAAEMRLKQDQIDAHNVTLRDLAAQEKSTKEALNRMRRNIRTKADLNQKIENMRRINAERRARLENSTDPRILQDLSKIQPGFADEVLGFEIPQRIKELAEVVKGDETSLSDPYPSNLTQEDEEYLLATLPDIDKLQAILQAYQKNQVQLEEEKARLESNDMSNEAMCRRIVSLCTGVAENQVDDLLPSLVAAVESEPAGNVDAGRVKEFLRKLEHVER